MQFNYNCDDVGFTHLVGLDAVYYYVSFKKNDKFSMQTTNWSFLRDILENVSMIWFAASDKLSILYYSNSENLVLGYLLSLLNAFALEARLDRQITI